MRKVVVFDMDETLGHFVQLSMFDYYLTNMYNKKISRNHFFKIMEMFPKILRPNIINIMKSIKKLKSKDKNIKVFIYTNNTGCKQWVYRIKSYIEKKIKSKIFDRVICGWKYDGIVIEPNRTGYRKTYEDLLRCGHLSKKDKIMFLDDKFHEFMIHKNVDYLHLNPYHYNIPCDEFKEKYLKTFKLNDNEKDYLKKNLGKCSTRYGSSNQILFKEKSNKIKKKIIDFLKKKKTLKNIKRNNKTRKI